MVSTYFGQVEASQGGVAGGHPGYPQWHNVAHPQDLAQHRAGVWHVLLVGHHGLAGLADHHVDFELHFLYRKQKKIKSCVFKMLPRRNLQHRHVQHVVELELTLWNVFHLSSFGLNEGPTSGPTLNVGVRDHVEQGPADGSRRCLSPG